MKIFMCFSLFACFVIDATHITNFMTHQVTEIVEGCVRGTFTVENPWPSILNSSYVYSIDMCRAIAGEYEMCDAHAYSFAIHFGDHVMDTSFYCEHGITTVPNGITTEYCFTSYACQWKNFNGNNRGNFGLEEDGNPIPMQVRYYNQMVKVPSGTPTEYLTRAATYKVETTEDFYLVDGYRVFDTHCNLIDCQITADTENGGSGTTHPRKRVKESVDIKKAATCLDDAPTLEVREIYLITFTCDEVCPKKLKVTGTKKPTASTN